jgi:CheY-like chemotaxis protein
LPDDAVRNLSVNAALVGSERRATVRIVRPSQPDPQQPEASSGFEAPKMDRALYQPLENRRILVVEDDPIIALDLRSMLEAVGATVVGPACELSDAFSLIETSKVDPAVLDYRLHVGDTLPLARMLRERRIPFLFETSDPGSAARKYPGAIILAKPFRQDQLTSAVCALLAGPQDATPLVDPTSGSPREADARTDETRRRGSPPR